MMLGRVWRPISRKRARKLRKRGEHVKWSWEEYSYVWLMELQEIKK